jgi:hypothetical protein
MNNKRLAMGLVVAGCLIASTSFGGGDTDFTSPACSTAEAPAAAAKPQPGAAVEKDYYKKLADRIDPANLNTACGTKITTDYDKSWHGHWIDMGVGEPGIASSMQDNCLQMMSQVKARCGKDDTSKKSVAAKIKKIECSLGTKEGTKVELKGTTLVGTIGPKACASDISDPTNKLLDAKL